MASKQNANDYSVPTSQVEGELRNNASQGERKLSKLTKLSQITDKDERWNRFFDISIPTQAGNSNNFYLSQQQKKDMKAKNDDLKRNESNSDKNINKKKETLEETKNDLKENKKSSKNERKPDDSEAFYGETEFDEPRPEKKDFKRLKKLPQVQEEKDNLFDEEEKKPFEPESAQNQYQCAICLCEINGLRAELDCCTHIFCFDCIKDWSKVTNQCPLCKERFKRLSKVCRDGKKVGELRVKHKNQVQDEEPEYEILEGFTSSLTQLLNLIDTDDFCYECQTEGDMQLLLVCDECSFYCCHTYCCNPPLNRIPVDPWYCIFCRPPPKPKARLQESKKKRTYDSAVTMSIRNSLPEGSLLRHLFEKADKEIEKKVKKFNLAPDGPKNSDRGRTSNRINDRSSSTKRSRTKERTKKETKTRRKSSKSELRSRKSQSKKRSKERSQDKASKRLIRPTKGSKVRKQTSKKVSRKRSD